MARKKKSPWVEWPGEGRMSFQEWWDSDEGHELMDMLQASSARKLISNCECLEFLCIDAVWVMAGATEKLMDLVDELEIHDKVIDWRKTTAHEVFQGIKSWTSSDHAPNILVIDHDDISDNEFVSAMTWWADEPDER